MIYPLPKNLENQNSWTGKEKNIHPFISKASLQLSENNKDINLIIETTIQYNGKEKMSDAFVAFDITNSFFLV